MRQGPPTAIACRPSRLPFNGCTLQPGMFRSESAVAAWSASIALLQRVCRSVCTFRLVPLSKSSRNPACRKLTITASSVKQTRQSVNCRFTLRPAPYSSRHAGGATRTAESTVVELARIASVARRIWTRGSKGAPALSPGAATSRRPRCLWGIWRGRREVAGPGGAAYPVGPRPHALRCPER